MKEINSETGVSQDVTVVLEKTMRLLREMAENGATGDIDIIARKDGHFQTSYGRKRLALTVRAEGRIMDAPPARNGEKE